MHSHIQSRVNLLIFKSRLYPIPWNMNIISLSEFYPVMWPVSWIADKSKNRDVGVNSTVPTSSLMFDFWSLQRSFCEILTNTYFSLPDHKTINTWLCWLLINLIILQIYELHLLKLAYLTWGVCGGRRRMSESASYDYSSFFFAMLSWNL